QNLDIATSSAVQLRALRAEMARRGVSPGFWQQHLANKLFGKLDRLGVNVEQVAQMQRYGALQQQQEELLHAQTRPSRVLGQKSKASAADKRTAKAALQQIKPLLAQNRAQMAQIQAQGGQALQAALQAQQTRSQNPSSSAGSSSGSSSGNNAALHVAQI